MERNQKLTITASVLAGMLLTLAGNAVFDVVSMPGMDAGTRLTVVPRVPGDAGVMELATATATLLQTRISESGAHKLDCRKGGAVNYPARWLCEDGQGAAFLVSGSELRSQDGGAVAESFGLLLSGDAGYARERER